MFRIIFPTFWLLDSLFQSEQKQNIRILSSMMLARNSANTFLKGAVNDDCCPRPKDVRGCFRCDL
ncbi:hypothetical protein EDF70_11430 [Neorhizobium sp. JUb45]|nr:hypothetical protein EDF70_11430 [Neorhizobium sp. JUb45]